MKILLIVSAFNSLTQRVFCLLKDMNHTISIEYAISDEVMIDSVQRFKPDIVFCPFLKKFIPKEIFLNTPSFVLHPGIRGDRGHNSLDHALLEQKKEWGVVILKANEELDGGEIYSEVNFLMRDATKASMYRDEVANATIEATKELLINLQNTDFKATPQLKTPMHKYLKQVDRAIEWEKDTSKDIIKKIRLSDSYPGVKDEFFGISCYLFGVWFESKLKGNPKEIIAKRDGAICVATTDGAIWISHLIKEGAFKLPATYVLKDKIKGVKEHRLPLIFDMSYKTFYEIGSHKDGDVTYLCFNFHNGAMHSEQCIRLKYAFEYLKESSKVIVLIGAEEFFSNGIHLNILEDSKKQGEDGWSNINAMNDLVKSIIFADEVITVASLHKNAGAGGVFLALACDYVVASSKSVLNPHYKTLGLSGSEYHTFSLPKRVGEVKAKKLLYRCLPISSNEAKKINMIDEVFSQEDYFDSLRGFCSVLVEDEEKYEDYIYEKQDYLQENENHIDRCKEEELKVMYPEFWDKDSSFHALRQEFVYKVCPIKTPDRLREIKNA
ncbi:hydrogenase maturation protein [Sulfurimonas sp.]|uniref:hydrogenase maturation protein n=1 Tax=Sulfurimonas sp. TaxID=2022749 RepID=UPI002B47A360|nr:hydrogenase maturation protein [Sulfurimonas sp.]